MYEESYKIKIDWKNLIIKLVLVVLFLLLIIKLFPMPKLDTFYNKIFNENITTMKEAAKNYFTSNTLPENIGDSKTLTLEEMLSKNLLVEFTDKNNNTCSNTNSFVQVTKTGNNEYVLKTQLSCDDDTDYILENLSVSTTCTSNSCNTDNSLAVADVDKSSTTADSINNDEDDDEDKVLQNGQYDKDGNLIGITEYQFKKPVYSNNDSYVCPDGYALDGTTCYKYETTETVEATPLYFQDTVKITEAKKNEKGGYTTYTDAKKEVDKETLTCPDGYKLDGNTCYKYVEATVVPGTTTYSCPDGYTKSGEGENTKCTKTTDRVAHTSGSTYYSCPNGGSLSGTTCYSSATYNSGSTYYTCPDGGTLSGTTCTKTTNYNATYHSGTTSCSCPSGGTLSGTTCTKSSSYNASTYTYWSNPTVTTSSSKLSEYNNGTQKRVLANSSCSLGKCTYTYYTYTLKTGYNNCKDGKTPTNGVCYTSSSYTASCSTSAGYYTCNGTKVSTSTCTSTSSYNATKNTTSGSYSCSYGTLNGTTCTYNATYNNDTNTTYTCPDGYTMDGTTCKQTVNPTKNTTDTQYTCPTGYTKNGTTCYKTTEPTKNTTYKYSCPDDYTKSGEGENTKCSKEVKSEVEYYCENEDEVLDGTNCIKTVKGTIKGYECPSTDYILDGTTCIKKDKVTQDAQKITNTTVTYKYQWSTKTSIDGWTRTGKTRTVSANEYIK